MEWWMPWESHEMSSVVSHPSTQHRLAAEELETVCSAAVALLDLSHLSKNQQKKAKRIAYQNAKREYERTRCQESHPRKNTIDLKRFSGHDSTRPCILCGDAIQPGLEYKAVHLRKTAGYIWAHRTCVECPPADRPICRHWKRNQSCAFQDSCLFAHPQKMDGRNTESYINPHRVRKQGRQGWFRRFLVKEFGLDSLRRGRGVLDVAAGKGELSFDLLNLCNITCTAVEPRPLNLESCVRRWRGGYYGRNFAVDGEVFRYQPLESADSDAPRMPKHVPIFFDHDVVSHAKAASEAFKADNISEGEQCSTSSEAFAEHRHITSKAAMGTQSASVKPTTMWNGADVHVSGMDQTSLLIEWFHEKILTAKRDRLKFGSCHSDDMHETMAYDDIASPHESTVRRASPPDSAQRMKAVGAPDDNAFKSESAPKALAMEGDGQVVHDVNEALHAMLHCSAVVGMHPDQAAEPIVDFALALRKPFALVPCCVHAASFPGRCDKSGRPVKTYDDLIAYLCAKDTRIRRRELPFDGRNVVLYFNPKPKQCG
eukprot:m.106576 g.106576  ORF g.106576 m.106576 type:complete len:542 (+) comp16909_c0_seq1:197-1822(+)